MSSLDPVRRQLNQILADTSSWEAELERRERQLARAMERQSQDRAVVAAYRSGCDDTKRNILMLIDDHLSCIQRTSMQAVQLRSLRAAVEDLP